MRQKLALALVLATALTACKGPASPLADRVTLPPGAYLFIGPLMPAPV